MHDQSGGADLVSVCAAGSDFSITPRFWHHPDGINDSTATTRIFGIQPNNERFLPWTHAPEQRLVLKGSYVENALGAQVNPPDSAFVQ